MFEQKDGFEINVNGKIVRFLEYIHGDLRSPAFFEISTAPECSIEFINLVYPNECVIGSMTFGELKDHILRIIPTAAEERGIEPFQLSRVHKATEYPYEEAVTLHIIGAGKLSDLSIEMSREPDVRVVRSDRYYGEKRLQLVAKELNALHNLLQAIKTQQSRA
jgi:hypothetical protein